MALRTIQTPVGNCEANQDFIIITKRTLTTDADGEVWAILAMKANQSEYVSWIAVQHQDDTSYLACYNGHYTTDFAEAFADYSTRS